MNKSQEDLNERDRACGEVDLREVNLIPNATKTEATRMTKTDEADPA